jgi:hypothetical protein
MPPRRFPPPWSVEDIGTAQMLSRFVQSPRPGQKHACHQNAEHDVIESVCENVHGVVPAMPKIARSETINVTERCDRTPLPAAFVR